MAAGIGKYGPPPGLAGGETGIRTLGTLSRTHAFQACALSRSAISPGAAEYQTPEQTQTLIRHPSSTQPERRTVGFPPCQTGASASCLPFASLTACACG